MDWSRAKTILIVIFFGLNIFLLYNVYIQESKVEVISQQDIKDIKTILKNNNIELLTTFPTKIRPKASLKIGDISYDEQQLVNNFLKGSSGKQKKENSVIYIKGNESLEFYSNKRIIYKNTNPNDNIKGFSKAKIIKYVEKFLKARDAYPQYAKVNTYESDDNGCYLTYKQVYKSNEIFASYMNIKLSNKGITEIDKVWFNPLQYDETSKNSIKTPIDVLLIFARDINKIKENANVKKISLGYYFPIENYNNASITATPAWKITTSQNNDYYYNAYEGYLEYTNDKGWR